MTGADTTGADTTGIEVENQSLRDFHDILHDGITRLANVQSAVGDAHVPADAYSGMPSGAVAQTGHTKAVNDLGDLSSALHSLVTAHAGHMAQTTANYRGASDAEVDGVRGIGI